ncbi:MAG TPA: alpha/beta hydrolase [Gemmatimonadota bacterium]|nr:alpha/beta hydrolase [Gemmatimonadota bacterium]
MPHIERVQVDDMDVPVEVRGRSSESLLFLPGMGVHPRHYAPGLDRLAHHFTVVAPDLSFGSNRSLPLDYTGYLACVDAVADRLAPGAPRVGHSLGGLLALQGDTPAVALSPLLPLPLGWVGQIWRAVRLQLREIAGIEGARGVRWALAILAEYVGMALTAPEKLFPALACTHIEFGDAFRPSAPSIRLVLGRFDQLYRRSEYGRFVEDVGLDANAVRWLPHGHDWPVTRPAVMEAEVLSALQDWSGSGGISSGTAPA